MKLKKLIIAGNIILSTVMPMSVASQQISSDTKKNLVIALDDNFDKELDHDKVIGQNFEDIIKLYGEKEGLALINKHFLIELNLFRDSAGVGPLELDSKLSESAQKQADSLSKEGSIYHMQGENAQRKRLQRDSISLESCGENLATLERQKDGREPKNGEGKKSIKKLINNWKLSTGHRTNMLYKKYNKAGLGIAKSKGKRTIVLYLIKSPTK